MKLTYAGKTKDVYALENGNINLDLVMTKLAPIISPNKKKAVLSAIRSACCIL